MSAALNLSQRQFRMKTALETTDRGERPHDYLVLRKPSHKDNEKIAATRRVPHNPLNHNRSNDWGTPDPQPGRASGHGGRGWG